VLEARDAAAILIANMVGVGILTRPGQVAAAIGDLPLALAAWALVGAVSLAGALVHAELGCRYPQSGGDYVFLREAFGPFWAFLSGWTAFAVGFPGAIALGVSAGADSLADAAGVGEELLLARRLLALALLGGISLVHSTGLHWGKRLQNTLVALELVVLLVLVASGWLLALPAAEAPRDLAPAGGIAAAGLGIFFSYSGWNAAAYVAGEIRKPERNLPRALVGGVLAVTLLYLAVNATYFRLVPPHEMGRDINIGGEVAGRIFGPEGGRALSLVTALVFLGAASAMVITGPRIYYAMARDGLFPRALEVVGASSRAPVRALWLQSAWAAVLLLSGTFNEILNWTIFALLPLAALTTCSVFVFRRRDRLRGDPPPFSTPGYPLTPLAFVTAVALVMGAFVVQDPLNAAIGSILVFSGVPAYWMWYRWRGGRNSTE